ncbi:MAG: uncharacterized protein H6R26_1864 [Proteobacteria bacterium]|nr:uncharacterized protein [Pseudomonadota bacterium]
MSNTEKKSLATVIGATLVTSLSAASVQAAENPFALKELASGYAQVAEAGKEQKESACGEGKCGAEMMKKPEMKCGAGMKAEDKAKEQKAMEGKCAGMKMDASPSPSAAPKAQ